MTYHEYIIVGAGPAGLQMGYFLEQDKHDYLILEAASVPASFFHQFPRMRTLISINKRFNLFTEPEFNLRHDWNSLLTHDYSLLFRNYSDKLYPHADDLCRYMADFAEKYALNIRYNTRVAQIDRFAQATSNGDNVANFHVTDTEGNEYTCKCLLMATGALRPYLPPEIEGLEHADFYTTVDIDPTKYENKRVVIMGRGNSAFEIAEALSGHAAVIHIALGNRPIKFAWQTHFGGDLRAINNNILDLWQLKALHAAVGFGVTKIEKRADGTFDVHFEEELPHWSTPGSLVGQNTYDHVICCTGWQFVDPDIYAEGCKPELHRSSRYPMLRSNWESSIPNLFYIGTPMGVLDRRAASPFIAGFRYNIRTLYHLLLQRFYGTPYPVREFEIRTTDDLEEVALALTERASISAGLYGMFGVLCDVLVFEAGKVKIYRELPVNYVLEQPDFLAGKEFMTFTLEFGFDKYPEDAQTLNFTRPSDGFTNRRCSAFLHATMRHYDECAELIHEGNLSSTLFIRYPPFTENYEEELTATGPLNFFKNFVNRIVKVTTEVYSEQHYNVESDSGFVPWALDDPRIHNINVPVCKYTKRTLPTNDKHNGDHVNGDHVNESAAYGQSAETIRQESH